MVMNLRLLLYITSTFLLLTGCEKVDLTTSANDGSGQKGEQTIPEINDSQLTPVKNDTIIIDGKLPEDCSLWNNHIVAFTETLSDNKIAIHLLARNEFTNVYSALADNHGQDATRLAASYSEEDITGWHIPTEDEGDELNFIYADEALTQLNSLLENYTKITINKSGSGYTRYLCEDATRTFTFSQSGGIRNAGATVKYNLRPMKTIIAINRSADDGNGEDDEEKDIEISLDDEEKHSEDILQDGSIRIWKDSTGNDHIVIKSSVGDDGNENLLLLSNKTLQCKSNAAIATATSYSEGAVSDWAIPTEEEAVFLRDTYGINQYDYDNSMGDLGDFYDIYKNLQDDETLILRKSGSNTRFLCANGSKTYALVKGTNIITSGKSTTYHLFLVKRITINRN